VIIYVSAQIDITGKAFETFLGVNYYTGAIAGFLIVVAYIFVGGFVAVVWSDVFQGVLMFLGLLALPLVAYFAIDHSGNIYGTLESLDPNLVNIWGAFDDPWMQAASMLGFAFIGLGFLGSPQVYVRFISVKNTKEIDKGKWVAIVFTFITDAAAVSIGILARYLFTEIGQDPESVLGLAGEDSLMVLLKATFPAFIVAIYIAIILSAIMSTIDSLLVVASSAITRDLYQKVLHPEIGNKDLSKMSARVTVIMALLALALAMAVAIFVPGRTVFWFTIFGWSGIAATFCPMIIYALFWNAFNQRGALACMLSGFMAVPFFKFYVQELEGIGPYFEQLDVMGPAFAVSFVFGFLFTRFSPKTAQKAAA
jgi:sodium/proline symporter